MEEPTGIEPVIAVLQTAPLATWVRLQRTEEAWWTRPRAGGLDPCFSNGSIPRLLLCVNLAFFRAGRVTGSGAMRS